MIYRLPNELQIPFTLITRSEVKQWVFNTFNVVCIDRINKKILAKHEYLIKKGKKGYKNVDGTMRKASHNFIDDRIVSTCMKLMWGIDATPGKRSKSGMKSHALQALACGSVYLDNKYHLKLISPL